MVVMSYVIKLLDVLKTNIDIITTDSDFLRLISTIPKGALPAYLIYTIQESDNNEGKPFLTFLSNKFVNPVL